MDEIKRIVSKSLNKKFGDWILELQLEEYGYVCQVCYSTDWTVKIFFLPNNDEWSDSESGWKYDDTTVGLDICEADYKNKISEILSTVKVEKQDLLSGKGKLNVIRNYLVDNLSGNIPEWSVNVFGIGYINIGEKLTIFYDDNTDYETHISEDNSRISVRIYGIKNPEDNLKFLENNIQKIKKSLE